jgi:hypothetical protein
VSRNLRDGRGCNSGKWEGYFNSENNCIMFNVQRGPNSGNIVFRVGKGSNSGKREYYKLWQQGEVAFRPINLQLRGFSYLPSCNMCGC